MINACSSFMSKVGTMRFVNPVNMLATKNIIKPCLFTLSIIIGMLLVGVVVVVVVVWNCFTTTPQLYWMIAKSSMLCAITHIQNDALVVLLDTGI